jgi:hypothetical protein
MTLDTAVCQLDGEEYDRAWDLDHEEHDGDHPNHYKFCDLTEPHWHDEAGAVVLPDDNREGQPEFNGAFG